MVEVMLKRSTVKGKKYDAIFPEKKVSFGSAPYEDYTIHKDDKRRDSYIKRHGATQSWTDIEKPQTWARYLLWEKKSIPEAIKFMENKFNIKIKNQT